MKHSSDYLPNYREFCNYEIRKAISVINPTNTITEWTNSVTTYILNSVDKSGIKRTSYLLKWYNEIPRHFNVILNPFEDPSDFFYLMIVDYVDDIVRSAAKTIDVYKVNEDFEEKSNEFKNNLFTILTLLK